MELCVSGGELEAIFTLNFSHQHLIPIEQPKRKLCREEEDLNKLWNVFVGDRTNGLLVVQPHGPLVM